MSSHGIATVPRLQSTWVWMSLGGEAKADPLSGQLEGVLELLAERGGSVDEASGLLRFSDPVGAVSFALELQRMVPDPVGGTEVGPGIGLCDALESADGLFARALGALAAGKQILTTRKVFDSARLALLESSEPSDVLVWLAHGLYRWSAEIDVFENLSFKVFEVGVEGVGRLEAPEGPVAVHNWVLPSRDSVLGWRPAVGRPVPGKAPFLLERLLGRGGFGEVWLASNPDRSLEPPRVFKFCFEAKQILALQREVTLFSLLKEELGDRDDITRILDWSFDSMPCYIEMEYSSSGDLTTWAESRGGLETVPLEQRLDLVCQVADALAAAHSVGVLHKDVKPENILIDESPVQDSPSVDSPSVEVRIQARLTDFGIGQLSDDQVLGIGGTVPLGLASLGLASLDQNPNDLALGDPGSDSALGTAATRIYEAPELMEGRLPTVQADVYALGVCFYQMVIGDLGRPMASGWQRDVQDELLREVIADACHARPDRRLGSASELATRVRGLDDERRRRAAKEQEVRRRRLLLAQVEAWSRRRLLLIRAAVVLAVFTLVMWGLGGRIEREVERADKELATANAVSRFLVELFEGASGDDSVSVEQLLDRGAHRARLELSQQPAVQGRLLDTIGVVLSRLGAYDKARDVLEDALTIRRRELGDEHLDTAESLHHTAIEHVIAGDVVRAQRYLRHSVQILEQSLGPEALELAEPLERLASIASRLNRFEEAEQLYDRAIEILEKSPGQEAHLGITLANASRIYQQTDRPYQAVDFLRRARALHERHLPPDHPTLGQLYAVLGDTYSKIGLWEEAEPVLLRAQEIFEPRLVSDHPYFAAILSALGRIYLKRGDFDQAEQALRRTVELVEPVMGTDSLFLMAPLMSLAETLSAKGELDEAVQIYDRIVALAEQHRTEGDRRIEEVRRLRAAALAARDGAP